MAKKKVAPKAAKPTVPSSPTARRGLPKAKRRPIVHDFPALLTAARIAAGYETVADAARALGWTYQQYADLERKVKVPRWDTAKAVILGLKLDPLQFFPELAPTPKKRKKSEDGGG